MATKKKANAGGIVMLPVNELVPHPDNPRREIGDVTELAENIRKNGIRQNLTVVDYGNSGYRIIIGHRRHAAAKLAGLKEVPCVIAEMTEREQLETMLAENLMREDLKLSEQVRTFEQLHLEGASADEIAGTTGFSKSYVSTRLKYASMIGADELKTIETRAEANERQVTLDELDKLCSIKSPADRQKLSEAVGTNNFSWDFRAIKEAERHREDVAEARRLLTELGATEITNREATDKYGVNNRFFLDIKEYVNAPEKAMKAKLPKDNTEPLFFSFVSDTASWFYICVGKPGSGAAPDTKLKQEQEAEKKRIESEKENELAAAFARAHEERWNFVNNMVSSDITDPALVAEFCMFCLISCWDGADTDEMADMFDLPKQGETEEKRFCEMLLGEAAKKKNDKAALLAVVKMAYVIYADSGHCYFRNRIYNEESVEGLLGLYGYLVRFGYEMSDEENALMYGSHELYKEADE